MEEIRTFVENIIGLIGISGPSVHILRHILLVFFAILLAWLTGVICHKIMVPLLLKFTSHTDIKWDDVIFNERVLRSACNIIPAIVIWALLPLIFYQFHIVREVLERITAIYITVMSARTAFVFVDSFNNLDTGMQRSSTQQYLKSFCGVLKILLLFIAAVVVIAITINRSPLALFAGLGATSAILMLIFKDTIAGLVAGVRLTSNDMLHCGDWITVPSVGADGTVEELTLTTIKIRNFDNSIVTVSPIALVDGSFTNWIGMQNSEGRRVIKKAYFDFNSIGLLTPDVKKNIIDRGYFKAEELKDDDINISLYRKYIENFIASRNEVNNNMFYVVRQLDSSQGGLPLEFYFFLFSKDTKPYEHDSAEIMDCIYAIAREFGLVIFQSQNVISLR
ncbi:MAG: mechanosensitive ion channel [Prevotella sp.]|mgnify:FL=1|jgi:miniconductance mechanosensitive channel|nr:mechanosensitive ion channel [Prevotella sp.]MBP7097579.1 mechanosensitive ion channel [Prevotella sp.]MBP8686152.1 mechanosensitive ion channel [Prevotella sp.]MBP8934472.1 mechanosensitive ion channel [Prevotella sp.]MBP9982208.1 mechanosensitive ion channel [Prevotella sp.]